MAIYVDALESWGWKMRGREVRSCHMFTDSLDLEELHVFAERIGMRRMWFQLHKVAPHYDLTASRRAAALLLGAIEVDRREASGIWRARREAVLATRDIRSTSDTESREQRL
ncbi:DUF4031 domain-containing protein [Paraburkholderia fungorum]|uniref:DUF4031 domain-containing protein n=1 Tax=Paraburkholderia fungorum TaxID=134537 RepID=UPI0005A5DD0F|nr:DUF4031 domain-containing protein [Paraburkholderia fungorum]MBB5546634.1 hypothetical protein [Paraburkholderia fungorum]PNE59889.1 DUF4031 domain-containing protein [Paraburkholderia fungorum]